MAGKATGGSSSLTSSDPGTEALALFGDRHTVSRPPSAGRRAGWHPSSGEHCALFIGHHRGSTGETKRRGTESVGPNSEDGTDARLQARDRPAGIYLGNVIMPSPSTALSLSFISGRMIKMYRNEECFKLYFG